MKRKSNEYPTTFIVSLDTLKWHLAQTGKPDGVSQADFEAVMHEVQDIVEMMPFSVSNGVLKRVTNEGSKASCASST